ncbi:MAG: dihydroneopterin aldolase family protein [Methanomassiliicoccales archaeon]|nr:dihydroneopterin aldolase family protein [Methanomassiliicoccales archaeon]HUT26436.1 dihydroneopterin aldolase family protein [Methanomassiliicoccales archaeon]
MTSRREELASRYFNCTERERAVFEAGIKLGTIYHQFVGTPVAAANVDILERAIEDGVRVQPFVKDVKVNISREALRLKKDEFDYQTLTGNMLNVELTISIDRTTVIAGMDFKPDLRYPLMYVKEIM